MKDASSSSGGAGSPGGSGFNGGSDPEGDANGGQRRGLGEPAGGRFPAEQPGEVAQSDQGAEWLRGVGESSDVVMSSRVRLARNIAGFPFMPKASRSDRQQVLDLCRRRILGGVTASGAVGTANLGSGEAGGGVDRPLMWVNLHESSGLERSLLVERHLISRQHARGRLSNGAGGPSEPRAIAVSLPDERLSIMINEEDHLRIQVIHSGLDLRGAFEEADVVDDHLERHLDFSFSPRFGYLTACPTNVGTGVRFSVMLHLPGLAMLGELEKVKHAAEDMSLALRGFYGEGSQGAGDFYQLSNQTTLGKSESVLRHELEHEIVPQVIGYERHARHVLTEKRRPSTEDTVHRALGVLRHARLVSSDEAMQLLSHVRLGVMLELLPELDQRAVNRLVLLTQQAHLQKLSGGELDQRQRKAARAQLIRSRLADASA